MKKAIIKTAAFLLILAALFAAFAGVYSFKFGDGIYGLKTFYRQPKDSIDVVFVGSSHIYENVSTGVLWDEYGIAAYDLAGSMQPVWNSYYYINECLKTQHPKLIVMDINSAVLSDNSNSGAKDLTDMSRIIKNTYGMKPSRDKLEAIKASANSSFWREYILEFPTYHTRYSELSKADYLPYNNIAYFEYWKGFGMNATVVPQEYPTGFETDNVGVIAEKSEEYFIKIFELCKEKGVPLLLIKTPYQATEADTEKFNRVGELAEAAGIPYVNFNYMLDEIGLDFSCAYADSCHMSYIGSAAFSEYLGKWLKDNYDLPDRRGEAGYESWETMARFCAKQMYNARLSHTKELSDYIKAAAGEDYIVIYNLTGNFKGAENYAALKEALAQTGADTDAIEPGFTWITEAGKVIHASYGDYWAREIKPNCWLIQKYGESVEFEGGPCNKFAEGLNVTVYDPLTETIVDSSHFRLDDGKIKLTKDSEQALDGSFLY